MDRDPTPIHDDATPAPRAHDPERDGDPRWRVTLPVMWFAQLCSIMGFSFVMPFIPFFVRELGVAESLVPIWAGVTGSAAGLAMATMGPIWGYLADRQGRRRMVIRAMFGGALTLGLMGLSRNVYDLLVLRILQGTVTGTVPASVALVSSVVPKSRLGFSLGLMQMAVFTGASIGPYIGGIVADQYGYRVPFGVTATLLFTGGLLVLFGARERFTPPDPEDRHEAAPLRVLFRMPSVLSLLGVFFIMNFSASFVMPIFPLFVEEIVGMPKKAASETGTLLAVTGVAGAVSAVLVGRVSDRLGHKPILIACTSLAALLSFPHFFADSVAQLLVLRLFFGLAVGGVFPAMNALVATAAPRDNLGQAYGFTTTASALGWATGPALGGVVASAVGYRWPFVIMAVLLALVTLAQRWWIKAPSSQTYD
jgi:DHA1 family multidrug resistance protein-like MFS transporter